MKYGVVILAGGKNTRMGTPKYQLQIDGVRFLDRLVYELGRFSELLISVDDAYKHPDIKYPMVSDSISDCGPMGGLYTALKECISDALITVPCDVPYFSKEMAEKLCTTLDDSTDAVIMVTKDKHIHPLCGIYKKKCLAVFRQCLSQDNYCIRDALANLNIKYCQAGKDSWRLYNVNTPKEFSEIQNYNKENTHHIPGYLAICGWKNSGKTTLIQSLIPLLKQKGYRIATIKHDGHKFEPDVPGTDSFRFFQAGADISIVYDKEKYSLSRKGMFSSEDITNLAYDADIILMEGFKWSKYPKIEVVRRENGGDTMPDIMGRIAYVSDIALPVKLPVFYRTDIEAIAAFIIELYKDGKLICE